MVLPNLFIPGAQRSGTTTVAFLIDSHKDICAVGKRKEPNFYFESSTRAQLAELYSKHYVSYQGQKIIADPSQYMGYSPTIPKRILEALGDHVRFIFILRNPVDRVTSAFNLYKYTVGIEKRRKLIDLIPEAISDMNLEELLNYEMESVKEALNSKIIKFSQEHLRIYGLPSRYFYISCYSKHIENFFSLYPRENFLFLTFEEVVGNQDELKQKIADFLEIDPLGFDDRGKIHLNSSRAYHNKVFQKVAPHIRSIVKRTLPLRMRQGMAKIEAKWLTEKPKDRFDEVHYRRLLEIYRPEIAKTEELTGLDLKSMWLGDTKVRRLKSA